MTATTDTKLVLLGTGGGPTPKSHRAAPAQAVTVGDATYVIDCGNGVGRQLAQAHIRLDTIRAVTVTHHHSDHNVDIGTLVQLAWATNLTRPVDIYGPAPLVAMMDAFFEYSRLDIATRIADEGRPEFRSLVRPHELSGPGVVYEDDRVRITCMPVNHPPMEAYAFRIDTDSRSIVISGDTAPCRELVELASGADVLVHEAIHLPSLHVPLSRTNGSRLLEHLIASHTDVEQVGAIAAAAGVTTLVLSHLVPGDAGITDDTWAAAASNGFDGEVIVGRDLLVV